VGRYRPTQKPTLRSGKRRESQGTRSGCPWEGTSQAAWGGGLQVQYGPMLCTYGRLSRESSTCPPRRSVHELHSVFLFRLSPKAAMNPLNVKSYTCMIHASGWSPLTARPHLRCGGRGSGRILAAGSGLSLRLDVSSRTGICPPRRCWRRRKSVAGRRSICYGLPMSPGTHVQGGVVRGNEFCPIVAP
jgi:hypothetical protein